MKLCGIDWYWKRQEEFAPNIFETKYLCGSIVVIQNTETRYTLIELFNRIAIVFYRCVSIYWIRPLDEGQQYAISRFNSIMRS